MEEQALSVTGQIEQMRRNGIAFIEFTEEDAAEFLAKSNFFFKLKAFDKNFDKYVRNDNPKLGQYIHLDFAYLVDLSRKDAVLRELVLDLALDLEHYLKVAANRALMSSGVRVDTLIGEFLSFSKARSLNQIADMPFDEVSKGEVEELLDLSTSLLRDASDGASKEVLAAKRAAIFSIAHNLNKGIDCEHVERSFEHLGSSHYSKKLVEKYGALDVMKPWHFMEMASFGDFIAFYKFLFFDSCEHEQLKRCSASAEDVRNARKIRRLLFPAKTLRNAAAHNDCLLNSLKRRMIGPIKTIYDYLLDNCEIQKIFIDKSWRVPAVHDYSALLICYELIVPDGETKARAARNMQEVSSVMGENLSYYEEQDEVFSALKLLAELTGCFSERWISA